MGLAAINIKFTADLKGFSTEMQNSIRRVGALGKELQNTGRGLSTYLSLPLVAAGAAAVKFASDYNESLNKVNVAFGPASQGVQDFAKKSLESFGIAEGTALDLASSYGDMATSLGLSQDKASKMSQSLVGLAGDLASFKNISIDIANTALTGVFTGETESLKKLGIVMTEANLQAYALSQGITKQFKDFSQAEKVVLRYNYILSVTKNSQGDFARTGGGAANQMRIFQESLKQVGQQLGAVILPAFTRLITFVNGVIKSFSGLSDETKTTIVVIAGIAAAIGPLLSVFGSLLTFIPGLITKFNSLKAAFVGLQAIIVANPYIALGVAIAAIAGGLYLWYVNTQKVVSGQQALNQAIAAGDKAASDEIGTLDKLYTSATNVKGSIDERKAAIKSLQEIYPAYFKNLDSENIKNGQAVGVYKELREAIFNKARATAIDGEIQKRANERVEKELEIRNKIAATENEITRLKNQQGDSVVQEANYGDKTARVTENKTNLLLAQNKLLKLQREELKKFTEDALASDQVLLDTKTAYNAKTGKLTENEIQRQKELISANALQAESNDTLKANTIAYFESLISAAQKEQKEVSLTGTEFDKLQAKIDAYQKKIDAISKSGRVLPKPAIPDDTPTVAPAFSLEDLKAQQSFFEGLRDRFATTAEEYLGYFNLINNTKIKIAAIEGGDEAVNNLVTTLDTTKQKMEEFQQSVAEGFASTFGSIAEGFGEIIGNFTNGGNALISIGGLIFSSLANLAIQVGKIAIATGIAILGIKKSLETLNPYVAIAAGVALIALGTIVKGQLSSAGAFADGGIVGGSSFYGDKIYARVNSGELILNQKQQKSLYGMMNTSSGESSTIIPDVKISGQDLIVVFNRAEKIKNRTS